jgi:hypothetical protein
MIKPKAVNEKHSVEIAEDSEVEEGEIPEKRTILERNFRDNSVSLFKHPKGDPKQDNQNSAQKKQKKQNKKEKKANQTPEHVKPHKEED